jgi:hypothetical protein
MLQKKRNEKAFRESPEKRIGFGWRGKKRFGKVRRMKWIWLERKEGNKCVSTVSNRDARWLKQKVKGACNVYN